MGQVLSFEKRFATALPFEQFIQTKLREISRRVELNGIEHTHPDFCNSLHSNDHPTSRWFRHQPDGIFVTKKLGIVHYYECKASLNMERDAYEVYMEIEQIRGLKVYLFFLVGDQVLSQHCSAIRFLDSRDVVSRWPVPYPIDSDGWICPRKARHVKNGSGTPYKEVDISCLRNTNWHYSQ